jgi:hypothetical protein
MPYESSFPTLAGSFAVSSRADIELALERVQVNYNVIVGEVDHSGALLFVLLSKFYATLFLSPLLCLPIPKKTLLPP